MSECTKEKQYIERMYNNAMLDPDVNVLDRDELEEAIVLQAEELHLDEKTCVELLNERFPQVMTADVQRASTLRNR